MDDPTSSLDEETAKIILANMVKQENLTFIMVSHNKDYSSHFNKVIKISEKKLSVVN